MIPILYDKTEVSFASNGLGRLADCIRCIVTEERNGVYECEFDYPISGDKYSLIQEGQIIAVTHDDNGDIQPFDIYHRTAPINGIVTFYARHISYRQIGITVQPFTASGVANAIAGIKTNSLGTNPFTYSTDKTTAGDYTVSVPSSAKALLGGESNSLLDVFGAGEYEFDKFSVKLWTRRGTDTDVEIRYGKNLSDIEHDVDYSEAYNGVVPYWYGMVVDENTQTEVETLVTLPEWSVMASGATYDGRDTVLPLDLSGEFDEPPSENDLRTLATQKLNEADTLLPIDNLTVSFVQLWQTDEYKNIAPLQKVKLCDTVHVIFPELGVNKTAVKVIRTVYNTLLDRYDEMELGDRLSSYASIVTANNTSAIAQLEDGLLIVSGAANQALIDADTAHDAAIIAQGAAADASRAAGLAQTAADDANRNAGLAQTAADYAQRDATAANKAANGALSSLSVVEDVLGVLNWVAEHGTYAATSDTEVVPGKFYFTRSGTAPDYIYTVVLNPSGDPSAQGYYELTGTDEAVSQYVSSHLALTNAGLYVINDNNSYKILLASDGMYVYDELGALVSKFGQSITFSDIRPQTIGNATNYIKFYDSNTDGIADSIEISGSNVNIASNVTIGGQPQSDYLNSDLIDIKTATGSIVSFSDGADYPAQDVTTTIVPIQAGTGTPSPSNPRAISGHTEANVSRTGKNLVDSANAISGLCGYHAGDNINTVVASTRYSHSAPIYAENGLTVSYLSTDTTTFSALLIEGFNASGDWVSATTLNPPSNTIKTYTLPANTYKWIRLMYGAPANKIVGTNITGQVQVEYGSASTYEAYQGDTYNISFSTAGTVYGGTLDVTTGVLTVTHGNISSYNGETLPSTWISDRDVYASGTTPTTGAQVVYELATPLTYNLTAQQIQILTGTNNIWSSTGDTTVKYVVGSGYMLDALTNVSANKYITQIGDDGIKVHAVNNTDQNYAKIDANGMEVFKGGNSVALYGDTARVGKSNSYNTYINPSGMAIRYGTTKLLDISRDDWTGLERTKLDFGARNSNTNVTLRGYTATPSSGSVYGGISLYTNGGEIKVYGDKDTTNTQGNPMITLTVYPENDYTVGGQMILERNSDYGTGAFFYPLTNGSVSIGVADSRIYRVYTTLAESVSSDGRFKEITGEVPDVSGIKAVRYRRIDDVDGLEHIGYIAQDIEPVAPFLVDTDKNGIMSLNYTEFLVAKVQSLENRIEELERRLK